MKSEDLQDPKARIAWLEEQKIGGFFLVSGQEYPAKDYQGI